MMVVTRSPLAPGNVSQLPEETMALPFACVAGDRPLPINPILPFRQGSSTISEALGKASLGATVAVR